MAAKLPLVLGSNGRPQQLQAGDTLVIDTSLAIVQRGYLDGLICSNDAVAPLTKIVIAAGVCVDSTATVVMRLTSALTKQYDANAWVVGNNKGNFTASTAGSLSIHLFLIRKDSDGTIDAGFDTSLTAANRPSGWTYFRRIASFLKSNATSLYPFHQYGDEFWYDLPIKDVDADNQGTAAVTRGLSVPAGVKMCVFCNLYLFNGTSAVINGYLSSLDAQDVQASGGTAAVAPLASIRTSTATAMAPWRGWTDTSGQIRTRIDASAAGDKLKIATLGFLDLRGRDS